MGRWVYNLRHIPFFAELGLKVIIHSKGTWGADIIKSSSGANEVVKLPNVGHEGGSYLHHILYVYDNPPRFVLVAQAMIQQGQQLGEHAQMAELQPWLFERLRDKFREDTGL